MVKKIDRDRAAEFRRELESKADMWRREALKLAQKAKKEPQKYFANRMACAKEADAECRKYERMIAELDVIMGVPNA